MRKSETTNTFTGGLIMDIHPLMTPNNILINCLNGTLVTFQGNENVLQNDMGNGRVQTANLPEGYVPLGTTSLGGIIYIVAYNPYTNKCQIGSFPSPERSIEVTKNNKITYSLKNSDFSYSREGGALSYYIKKAFNDNIKFSPGDKFIIYGDTISDNYFKFYDSSKYNRNDLKEAKKQTIKLDIGTITEAGKLVKFSNLKEYKIEVNVGTDEDLNTEERDFIIFNYKKKLDEELDDEDLNDYRSSTKQPYNIFNSKVSGTLVLIAELIQFNNFGIQLTNNFIISEGNKIYNPKISFEFSGDYPFIPQGVVGQLSLTYPNNKSRDTISQGYEYKTIVDEDIIAESNTTYEFKDINLFGEGKVTNEIVTLSNSGYFNKIKDRESCILKYSFTPCMNWGKLSFLQQSGQIDLSKIGTGYINLTHWKYFNDDATCNLIWGLEIYEEEDKEVSQVQIIFSRLKEYNENNPVFEDSIYTVKQRESYFGIFDEHIDFNTESNQLNIPLIPNTLYLAKIVVKYGDEDRIFFRWLYTNKVFNEYYTKENDYDTLLLNLTTSVKMSSKVNYNSTQYSSYGKLTEDLQEYRPELDPSLLNKGDSLSAIQTKRTITDTITAKVVLENDYDSFDIAVGSDYLREGLGSASCTSESSISYTDIEDPESGHYLDSSSKIVQGGQDGLFMDSEFQNYNVEYNEDSLATLPTNVTTRGVLNNPIHTNNTDFVYKLNLESLHLVKAYCTKQIKTATYSGSYHPLAYDAKTFRTYHLTLNQDSNSEPYWFPDKVGLYGVAEKSAEDAYFFLGSWTPDKYDFSTNTKGDSVVDHRDGVHITWGKKDEFYDIRKKQKEKNWNGPIMFMLHTDNHDTGYLTHIIRIYHGQREYSIPFFVHNLQISGSFLNRVELAFKSTDEDSFYYPINHSMSGKFYTREQDMLQVLDKITKTSFFQDFASFLNSIYIYEPNEVLTTLIYPNQIYWMSNCKYTYNNTISFFKGEQVEESVYFKINNEYIDLNNIIESFKAYKLNNYQENIDYNISNLTKFVKFKNITIPIQIPIIDNTSGLKLRDTILFKSIETSGIAIMDYDNKRVVGRTFNIGDTTAIYNRIDDNQVIEIRETGQQQSLWFVPKAFTYSLENNEYIIKPKNETIGSPVDLTRFTISNGELKLKVAYENEQEFKWISYGGSQFITGYQNAYILSTYKGY